MAAIHRVWVSIVSHSCEPDQGHSLHCIRASRTKISPRLGVAPIAATVVAVRIMELQYFRSRQIVSSTPRIRIFAVESWFELALGGFL